MRAEAQSQPELMSDLSYGILLVLLHKQERWGSFPYLLHACFTSKQALELMRLVVSIEPEAGLRVLSMVSTVPSVSMWLGRRVGSSSPAP